ncbi:hypothetical protein GCM10023200_42080 [Actinomycetospora chlora]|uniref:Uncharacterized protein n=1 Tax=Actinomycetospora chlora TaxID=663608 RepID=A0ABP9BUS7_9PSEU
MEMDMYALAESDKRVHISGNTYFYEGATEDTSDLDDSKSVDFMVPRHNSSYPGPFVMAVQMRNVETVGSDDLATVTFSFYNKVGDDD